MSISEIHHSLVPVTLEFLGSMRYVVPRHSLFEHAHAFTMIFARALHVSCACLACCQHFWHEAVPSVLIPCLQSSAFAVNRTWRSSSKAAACQRKFRRIMNHGASLLRYSDLYVLVDSCGLAPACLRHA